MRKQEIKGRTREGDPGCSYEKEVDEEPEEKEKANHENHMRKEIEKSQ